MSFYDRVLRLCNQKGIAISNLGKEIGSTLSSGTISRWKTGAIPHRANLQAIADYFGVSVEYLLGEAEPESDHPRAYRVPVLGRVAAGLPLYAVEEILDWEELPLEWKKKGEYFGLQIQGDSMEPRICEGDVVIVRKQEQVENGEIAIVLVNGDSGTCKKVLWHDKGVTLISLNANYAPQFYTCDEVKSLPVTILGKVVELRGKF